MKDLQQGGAEPAPHDRPGSMKPGDPLGVASTNRWVMVGVWTTLVAAMAAFAAALISYWPS